jgi:hypothetical protein
MRTVPLKDLLPKARAAYITRGDSRGGAHDGHILH